LKLRALRESDNRALFTSAVGRGFEVRQPPSGSIAAVAASSRGLRFMWAGI